MPLNANTAQGGGRRPDPIEAGTYPARLVQVLDLGLQPQRPFQGKEKPPVNEISLTYEFVDEFMKDEEGNDQEDKPRWKSETMPFYNLKSERAKSTLRYNALDPNHVYEGEWDKLLGLPCMITITHSPRPEGGVYENVAAVSSMREKDAQRLPQLVNEPKSFDLSSPDLDVFESLPPWLKEKITSNLEYEGSELQRILGTEGPAKTEQPTDDVEPDENPF